MSDSNITTSIFQNQYKVTHFVFEKTQLVNIMAKYLIIAYNKLLCHISFLREEKYI